MFDWKSLQTLKVEKIEDWNQVVAIAAQLIRQPAVILLDGPMGVGKTEFVKRLVANFGGKMVASPTFALHNHYSAKMEIDHWDLYRLNSEDELESSGFYDGFSSAQGLVVVEWAARLDLASIPWNWNVLHLKISLQKEIRIVEIYERVKRPEAH